MKIVHIITRLIIGGAQENTLITCKELAARGHDVTLITGPPIGPEGQLLDEAKKQSYKTIVIDELIRKISPFKDWAAYERLKDLLEEIQPDIVHTHSAKAGILGRYAGYWLKENNIRLLNNARNNVLPSLSRACQEIIEEKRIPKIIHTIHGLAFHKYQNALINKFYIAIEKIAAKRTDAFISVADAMTAQTKAVGIGIDKPYTTAYSAIEEDDFLNPPSAEDVSGFRQKYNIPQDAVVLVTIARLFELKGHDYIIESAKQLAGRFENCVWLFVGDGNLTDKIKKQIGDLGLSDRFRFTGLLSPNKISLVIHSSDILLHCSVREGLARAIVQGFLCGKPAVAFDLDGTPEVVNPDTGRLVEAGNIEQLVESCGELIADGELRDRLGAAGREFVKMKFAPAAMADTIQSVYDELLTKG